MSNLDELTGESETPWAESIADTIAQSVEDQVGQGLIDEKVIRVLKSDLKERDREIIFRLFGFEGNPFENAEEIGQALGLSRERTRQIKEKIFKKLAKSKDLRELWRKGDPPFSLQQPVIEKKSRVPSPREIQVLELVEKGLNNKEIAERLKISWQTVKNHFYSIFRKIRVKNRTEAMLFYLAMEKKKEE